VVACAPEPTGDSLTDLPPETELAIESDEQISNDAVAEEKVNAQEAADLTSEPEDELDSKLESLEGLVSDLSGTKITFWHIWGSGERGEGLDAIVDAFNQSNEWGITVESVDMGFYSDIEDEILIALQNGNLPDVVIGYPNALATWYSLEITTDINLYLDDPVVGFNEDQKADFYRGSFDGVLNTEGARLGLPIGQSIYVLFYNQTWAQELGFEMAPQTSSELKEQACAAAAANDDGTGGLVLFSGASYVMPWIYAFGGDGLSEDGFTYNYLEPEVNAVAHFWKEIWDEDCAFSTKSYPNPEFANRKALFVMSSSAGLPYQIEAFDQAGSTDEWGFISFPGPDGQKAVTISSQYMALVNNSPDRSLASWMFMKYFTSPEVQAKWVEAGGYYPVRESSEDLLKSYASEHPIWLAGLKLLEYGFTEPSLASWGSVRKVVQDAFDAILQGTAEEVPVYLYELNNTAAELVAEIEG
jgi:ABC-type glycerol-3-phosphate transport system substrate-binding protein